MTESEVKVLAERAAAAVDEAYLVDLARRLVQTRSVFEPERGNTEKAAAELLVAELQGLRLEPTLQEAAPNRPNVIADWQGTAFDPGKHKTLMFEGHTDVVTEGDADAWTYPPFEGRIEDGKLYGRGSADMKGGVAASLAALRALQKVAPDLPGRLRFGFVADEEGMMLGIKHFIEQGWADEVDGAIICEPEENELCLFQKGALRVSVTFQGVMAHGAMPYAGKNPIAGLSAFLERVRGLEQTEQKRLGEHPHLGLPWFTPTIVKAPAKGEAQHNVMPGEAYLALDIRTVPGQEHDEVISELQRAAREVAAAEGLEIQLDPFESRPWTETATDDPLVAALEASYPLVFDTPPRYGGVPGATDGTFLSAWACVPVVTVGPGERTVPHKRDEYVAVADLLAAARLYAAAAVFYLTK